MQCLISGILLLLFSVTGLSQVIMKLIPRFHFKIVFYILYIYYRSVKIATIVGMGLQIGNRHHIYEINANINVYIYIHIYIHAAYKYACVHKFHTFLLTYIHTNVNTYIHTYIHTYTRT